MHRKAIPHIVAMAFFTNKKLFIFLKSWTCDAVRISSFSQSCCRLPSPLTQVVLSQGSASL